MEFEQLLQYLAKSLGHESFELNENGVLSLSFGDGILVNLEPEPDGLTFQMYSVLCRLPDTEEEAMTLFEALLKANCFGRGTSGAVFALDEQQDEILLCRSFSTARTEPADLFAALQDMVSVMDVWRERLPELGAPEPEAAEAGQDPSMVYAIRV